MFKFIKNLFFKRGVINLGNGNIEVYRNRLTGSTYLNISNDTIDQLFKEIKD